MALITLLLLAVVSKRSDTVCANSDNAQLFGPLCKLLQLSDGIPTARKAASIDTNLLSGMQKLNMSQADDAWRVQFVKDGKGKQTWEGLTSEQKVNYKMLESGWEQWAETKSALAANTTFQEKLAKAGFTTLTQPQKVYARSLLERTVNEAEEINKLLEEAERSCIGKVRTQIKAELNSAVYGDSEGPGDYGKSGAPATDRQTVTKCNDSGKVGGSAELAYTILCLCLPVSGQEAAQPCAKDVTLTQHWGAATSRLDQIWKEVRSYCPATPTKHTTAAEIRTAISDATAMITLKTNVGYLGKHYSGNCGGSSASGLCVKYNGIVSNTQNKFSELAWVKNFLTAADKIQAAAAAAHKTEILVQKLKELNSTAWGIPRLIEGTAKMTAAVQATNPFKAEKSASGTTKWDCAKHKANVTCTADNNCKWEGTTEDKGICKPKAGSEIQAAGTGEKQEQQLQLGVQATSMIKPLVRK
uniref:Variant surface glycoprotein 1125.1150 n=1 Tax=Trypanosoma brucei TaxID=5691 RepID=A0A1J0R4F5_9TRYP|nr:variant surface glycoprotein 1125.1150 [Trypanosoma brucei]